MKNWLKISRVSEYDTKALRQILGNDDLIALALAGKTVISGGYIITDLLTADNIITGKLLSADGKTYFDLDNDEIKLTTTINEKPATVTISPTKPFELAYDGLPLAYLTAAGVWVTSRYDINEDGVVDELDYKMIRDAILNVIPDTARMDLDGNGVVNSTDSALWLYANRSAVTERRIGMVSLNDTTWTTVTFDEEMVFTPHVFLTPNTTNAGVIAAKVKDVSTTGFSAIIGGTAPASDFSYLAIS